MKHRITALLTDILQKMGIAGVVPGVEIPEDASHGDYTTNVAMTIAKTLKKSPMEIALQVAQEVKSQKSKVKSRVQDQNIGKRGQIKSDKLAQLDQLQAIDRVDVVPPGFINIFLIEASLITQLQEVLKEKEGFGTSRSKQPQRVTVEFTDPNPFKEFHIGHLYSNSVGEAISRLLENQGHTVRRVNYQGDIGMHVAKAIWALLQNANLKTQISKLKTVTEKAEFLGKAYAAGSNAFEENEQSKKAISEINKKIYAKDPDVYALYQQTRAWSLEYFETIYRRLGTTFAGYYFESEVGQRGVRIVREHIKDGVFEESEGAIVYRGEKKGLHTRVFINQLGLPTYEAKELGLAPAKYDDWGYDCSLIVTGNEINEYFKVLLAALSEVNPALAQKTRHIGHGMVRKSDGTKMSSRSGDVLTGEGLLDEVKASIYTLLDKNKLNYTKGEREEIAEKAAVAAVKYSLLRVSLPSDVAFDLKTSVSFEGDSGPYLQYTYARARSVLRKSQIPNPNDQQGMKSFNWKLDIGHWRLNAEERSVLRLLVQFPDVVAQAAGELSPSTLCTYLFKLAQTYNLFYAKHPILGSSLRLALTVATARVLKNGLYLLGIETLEQM